MGILVNNEERLSKAAARAEAAAARCEQLVDSIVFVKLAETGVIDDVTATEHTEMFGKWEPNVDYVVGNMRTFGAGEEIKLYRCVQAHRSQADWAPDVTPALWDEAGDPAEEWPAWSQPIGSHDAYNQGDKASHNEKHWISNVDANVWEPGVYGWTETY